MKTLLITLCVLLSLSHLVYSTQSGGCNNCLCPGLKNHWHAPLVPTEEVPRVNSTATAFGAIHINLEVASVNSSSNETDPLALRYHLFMKGNNLLAAHIHVASRCVAGPIVAFLAGPFPGNGTSLPFGGLLAEGVLTSANLTGPLAGFTILDLVEEIKAGNAYVNVHSVAFPSGESRGQLRPLQEDTVIVDDLLSAAICTGDFNSFLRLLASNGTAPATSNSTGSSNSTTGTNNSILETASSSLNESEIANLSNSSLAGAGPFTIFAPIDETFSLGTLDANTTQQQFLGLHIVSGAYTFSDFLGKIIILESLAGVNLTIDGLQPNQTSTSLVLKAAHRPRVTVNGVRIVEPDAVIARNGVIHGIAGPLSANAPSNGTSSTTTASSAPARRFRQLRRW